MGRSGKKKVYLERSIPPSPPWIELPRDVTENILSRIGAVEILKNAQKACTTWRSVCNEPSMWRVIHMKYSDVIMCRRAVDRSRGELIDINIEYFGDDALLRYISERSSRLKRFRLQCCDFVTCEGLTASVKIFPELEELHLIFMWYINAGHIEAISISCPKLKSFSFTSHGYRFEGVDDSYALTIAKNMPCLTHLCLLGNSLSNEGPKAILDGCPNLESLDLRMCFRVDLRGDFGRICSERIKHLKCPFDSIVDYVGW